MGERLDGGRLDVVQEEVKGRVAGQIVPHRERVHEQSDQPGGVRVIAPGGRHADDHIGLLREAKQQHLESRQQRHEQGGVLAPTAGGSECRASAPRKLIAAGRG